MLPQIHLLLLFSAMIIMLFTLVTQRKHFLMALLALEGVVLVFSLMIPLTLMSPNLFMILLILCLGACEASLGLALLVVMTRFYASDLIKSLSINKC
uniref:NADH dehydrogenase subunit 4L n=1 Tax=Sternaspis sendalli TaxID=2607893 RepID=UPI00226CE234|nr:NADH dehydrogenase subunit 4L [Sternaspis sendalli]UZP47206.1 NADH dehydrogenase subunit 4L [Sternaspis sendalli]